MNQLQLTKAQSQKEQIQSTIENLLGNNSLWELRTVEIDQYSFEIHVYLQTKTIEKLLCPDCKRLSSIQISQTSKKCTYPSICGMKTYIHAKEIQIMCTYHVSQFIIPPWNKQINEQLNLSVL